MPEKLYVKVGSLKINVPSHVAHLCTTEEHDRRKHGIDWEVGASCESCGTVTERKDRPRNRACPGCNKMWPFRCHSVGCDVLLEPDHANGQWYEPYPYCQACEKSRLAEGAEEMLDEVPNTTLGNAIEGWRRAEHRVEAEKECKFWLNQGLGRDYGNRTGMYFYGDVGTGKTTIAARCAVKAIRAGMVQSFVWVKEYDLMMASKAVGYDAKQEAASLFRRVETAELAVIDEMFAVSESLSDKARVMIGQALAKRFEERLPTIVTSNHEPAWAALYDVRVNSRFNGMFNVIKLNGPDLRQHFGGGHE